MTNTGISIIILTRDSEKPIERLLESFLASNTYQPVEFIIIDHGSTDHTSEVISRFASRTFIRLIKRDGQNTTAASCNLAAGKARYPSLLFLNCGIGFTSDILPAAVAKLSEPDIGAVGVRLDSNPNESAVDRLTAVKHAGIVFEWDMEQQFQMPKPVRHNSERTADSLKSGFFPAVTGDFLMCRKEDFDTLGGFHESYDAGFEAIDFCLQIAMRLGRKSWCINDIGLQLSDGGTGKFGLEADPDERRQNNVSLFKGRVGNYLDKLYGAETPAPQKSIPVRQTVGVHQSRQSQLNILFVLYESIDSNGGLHVQLHAERLSAMGVDCRIAYPTHKPPAHADEKLPDCARSYARIESVGPEFSDGRGPDIVHAWTPREIVRVFCEKILDKYSCPLIVHLEDNEAYLTEVFTGLPFAELEKMAEDELGGLIPESCYHPFKGRKFLDKAQGLTLIINTLSHFNTRGVPAMVLPPPVDERLFFPRPLNLALRKELGIPESHLVLAYTGNVHSVNRDEVLELYKAVSLLNERGIPCILIRTGINGVPLGEDSMITAHEKNLGWVSRERVPDILAAADVLVQPGSPGLFNDQRVPSKLPEYFAMGRPVILPRTNLGLKVNHMVEGCVLDKADAISIVSSIIEIHKNRQRADKLGDGGVDFYLQHFSLPYSKFGMDEYYRSLKAQLSNKLGEKEYTHTKLANDSVEYEEIIASAKRNEISVIRQDKKNNSYSQGIDLGTQATFHYGQHRFGWIYIVDNLQPLNRENGLYFDTFVERSMIWGDKSPTFIDRDWIGIVHNPPNIPGFFQRITNNVNFGDLIKTNPVLRASLKKCRGLITLSRHHKNYVKNLIDVPVTSIQHPTGFISTRWNFEKFLSNKLRKVVQIGWWLRNLHAIYMLDVDPNCIEKIFLSKDEHQIIRCFEAEENLLKSEGLWKAEMLNTAKLMHYLPNEDYDKLLTESVVFLDLYDASANNSIIECIVRNTPILINQIPAVVEYLGDSYPLYYKSYDEASQKIHNINLIYDANIYLENMDKSKLSIDSFKNEVSRFVKDALDRMQSPFRGI